MINSCYRATLPTSIHHFDGVRRASRIPLLKIRRLNGRWPEFHNIPVNAMVKIAE